ncbi:MAG: (Fe-S)-binding protein, partial [Planctomycetota bacterium]
MGPMFMLLLLVVGFGAFAYSANKRWRLLRIGAPANRFDRIADRARATWNYAFLQLRMRRYPIAGLAHMVIFLGFIVLLPRTLILWGRAFDESFNLWVFEPEGSIGKAYSLLKDVFAVLVVLGALTFVYFRVIKKLGRLTLNVEGLVILGIILTMMIADIVYDGASMVRASREASATVGFHAWEPAGSVAQFVFSAFPDTALAVIRHLGFWTHSILVLLFLNLLPYSKHFHIITGVPNVFAQNLDSPGRLPTIEDMDGKLEREETLGIRRIEQFSWKSILDFYTCTECGRCSDHCPATKTGKKLSPKHFTIDLRNFLYENQEELIAEGAAKNGALTIRMPSTAK